MYSLVHENIHILLKTCWTDPSRLNTGGTPLDQQVGFGFWCIRRCKNSVAAIWMNLQSGPVINTWALGVLTQVLYVGVFICIYECTSIHITYIIYIIYVHVYVYVYVHVHIVIHMYIQSCALYICIYIHVHKRFANTELENKWYIAFCVYLNTVYSYSICV